MTTNRFPIRVSLLEYDTILAALRLWQNVQDGRVRLSGEFSGLEDYEDIATCSGDHEPITADAIDDLIERIQNMEEF